MQTFTKLIRFGWSALVPIPQYIDHLVLFVHVQQHFHVWMTHHIIGEANSTLSNFPNKCEWRMLNDFGIG
jgi:hypothetical protein